jgi:hypothetical protein
VQEQGFSVRSAEGSNETEALRYCSAKKTAAKCGWFLKIEVKSVKKGVVEECAAHSHPLEKGAEHEPAPKGKGKGKQRERSSGVEPVAVKWRRNRGSTPSLVRCCFLLRPLKAC